MKLQNILDAGDELADALAACEGIIAYDYSPSALGTLRAAYDVASKLNVNTNDSETILNAARALKTAVGNNRFQCNRGQGLYRSRSLSGDGFIWRFRRRIDGYDYRSEAGQQCRKNFCSF